MKAARDYPILTVTAKGTRWLESGHPWVYDSDVACEPEESECENGALVDVVSEKGKYLGTGFLSRLSKLRVRIVSRNANDRFDENFWRRRVRYAWDYRKAVMDGQTGCCRLIFGEADAFPGLTVDRFENLLVTQTLSLGMEKIKDMLFPLIVEVLEEDGEKIDGLFERNDVLLREKEGIFLWCLEGLHRLIGNNYQFTVSTKARENMETVKRSSNNVIEFLQSEGYIRFRADSEASSKALYEAYQRWCEDNAQKPMSANRLSSELAQNERLYNVEATNNVHVGGKRVRGFVGIEVVNPLPY